ncbi:MAG TPA: hypothetical protein VGX69_12395 [Solirubrobacteraceae bacterium]|jgi:hypothetical protein|nr:hypothetical protein [Solirubrobacteraceae bacterium]
MINDTDRPQKGPSMLDRLRPKRTLASTDTPLPSTQSGVVALAVTLALGLVVGGCGSSKSPTSRSTTTAALSKPQFLAQGNAICAQGNQSLGAADKALGNQPSKAQITRFVASTFAPDIQRQIDGLRALNAPSSDRAAVSNMLDTAQTDLDKIESDPALLASGAGFTEFAHLAHPYGLTACAPSN